MKLKRNHLLIAAAIVVGALFYWSQGGRAGYIGGISANSPKGAGGADSVSALPRGYRSDPPNSPYTSRAM